MRVGRGPDGDPDEFAYGDLPYACEHAYSQKIEDFTGLTRVVGRLPDLTAGKDPAYLIGLLETAANFQSRPKADFAAYLGITAKVWSGSTKESLENVFGSSSELQMSPAKGPNWSAALLSRRSHFVNCHGAQADFRYYGQQGNNYPVAHDASLVEGKISEGTVAAAECCYGAELYDPAIVGQAGMCNTYLASKAYAFIGSSTIAYGPPDDNGAADLITQYFLKHVLAGASTGRAALQARQDFVLHASIVDPVDLKTLAQFSLMGDPAIHPAERAPAHLVGTTRLTKGLTSALLQRATGLALRRDALIKNGMAIAAAANVAIASKELTVAKNIRTILQDAAKGARLVKFASFAVESQAPLAMRGMKAMATRAAAPATIHLAVGRMDSDEAPARQLVAVVAREQEGAVSVRRLVSR